MPCRWFAASSAAKIRVQIANSSGKTRGANAGKRGRAREGKRMSRGLGQLQREIIGTRSPR